MPFRSRGIRRRQTQTTHRHKTRIDKPTPPIPSQQQTHSACLDMSAPRTPLLSIHPTPPPAVPHRLPALPHTPRMRSVHDGKRLAQYFLVPSSSDSTGYVQGQRQAGACVGQMRPEFSPAPDRQHEMREVARRGWLEEAARRHVLVSVRAAEQLLAAMRMAGRSRSAARTDTSSEPWAGRSFIGGKGTDE